MAKLTASERAEYLFKVLQPCLKRSSHVDWTTFRYLTAWGSKTEEGLKATIVRIISGDDLPKLEG